MGNRLFKVIKVEHKVVGSVTGLGLASEVMMGREGSEYSDCAMREWIFGDHESGWIHLCRDCVLGDRVQVYSTSFWLLFSNQHAIIAPYTIKIPWGVAQLLFL